MESQPLPAVRDLSHDGGLSMYDENVRKLPKVSFQGVIRALQSNIVLHRSRELKPLPGTS
jgi:hypothetical protein